MPNKLPSISIEGVPELTQWLTVIGEKQALSNAQKAMRSVGMKVIRDARKRLTKNHGMDTGQLKKSLGVRAVKVIKGEGKVVMYIGPRGGFGIEHPIKKRPHNPYYIAHLVEFGHRIAVGHSGSSQKDFVLPRFDKIKGETALPADKRLAKDAGFVKARPFLRPAVDANKSEFTKQMVAKLRELWMKPPRRRK